MAGKLFAHNPTHKSVPGAINRGNISIENTKITNYSGLNWYMGPNESIVGWYIAGPNTSANKPQFWSPAVDTEAGLLDLLRRNFKMNFQTAQEGYTWLENNGYWMNFILGPATTTTSTTPIPTTTTTTLPPTTTTTTLPPTTTTTTLPPTTTTTTLPPTTTTTTLPPTTTTTTLPPTTTTTTLPPTTTTTTLPPTTTTTTLPPTTTTTTLPPTTTTTTLPPTTTTTTLPPTTTTTTLPPTTTTTTLPPTTTTTTLPPTTTTTTTEIQQIIELFTSSGSWYSSGLTSIEVECWGGGGSGAGATTTQYTGGGGGGAYSKGTISISQNTWYNFVVGESAPGTLSNGTPGNPTWFGSITTVYAEGGGAGGQNSAGIGGQASNGYPTNGIRYSGGNGRYINNTLNGGGGAAGSTGNGETSTSTTGGLGASEYGGNGGSGVQNPSNSTSAAGFNYGGGGGGIRRTNGSRYGGDGAQGLIRISYYS